MSFAGRQPTQSPVEVSQTLPAGLFAQSASALQGIGITPPVPPLPLLLLLALLWLIPPPAPMPPPPDGVPLELLTPLEPLALQEATRRPTTTGAAPATIDTLRLIPRVRLVMICTSHQQSEPRPLLNLRAGNAHHLCTPTCDGVMLHRNLSSSTAESTL